MLQSDWYNVSLLFYVIFASFCTSHGVYNIVCTKAQSRSPPPAFPFLYMHELIFSSVSNAMQPLLHYYPACLSPIWLKQGHWLRLAQTCRHPPSGRPEPQSVTTTDCYCSTVQLCTVVTTSPDSSLYQSLLQPLLHQLHHSALKPSICPVSLILH